jgi:hypothetical protein
MAFDWKNIVGAVAPSLAAALGGPMAGLAVKTLSNALLGNENGSEAEISAALNGANNDQLVRLKEADQNFAVQMKALDIDLERINKEDRDSARKREVNTGDVWTPRVIGFLTLGGFLWAVFFVLSGQVQGLTDPVSVGMIGTLIGYISAKADQVVSYYFGSSAGSAKKTDAMSDALNKQVNK